MDPRNAYEITHYHPRKDDIRGFVKKVAGMQLQQGHYVALCYA